MASTGSGATLFDYVIVVAIKDGAPFVKWCFPQGRERDPLVDNIKKFCFPDIDQYPKSKLKAETFSFVLTESDGAKRWGYCRRTLEPGEGKRYPWCFCIVSVIQPLPAPGGSFTVTVRSIVDAKPETFFFTRPDDSDSMFDYVNFEPLLHMLDAINIISVFTSLLIERRIIFIADELPALSACVQAAVALLYPFSWQHVFIPVLPPSLLTFCCAPMPFVVGILRSSVSELNKLSDAMDEVAIVDIDRNKFLSDTSSNDYGLLPANVAAPLMKAVAAACKTVKSKYSLKNRMAALKDKKIRSETDSEGAAVSGGNKNNHKMSPEEARNLANAFIAFFVDLMGNYRSYIVASSRDPTTNQLQLKFDKSRFLEDQPPEARRLMELFVESQMFEVFIQERAKTQRVNAGRFEQRVTMYMQQGLDLNDPGCDKKKAVSRFTMYENGEISRADITKTVNQMLEDEARKTEAGNLTELSEAWSPSTVLMEGSMSKLGGRTTKLKLKNRGVWRTRWCQLSPTHLAYFNAKGDAQPTGCMALKDIVSISFTTYNDLVKKANCLDLQTPGRAVYLVTDTLEEGEKWVKAISRALQNLSQTQPTPTLAPEPSSNPSSISTGAIRHVARGGSSQPARRLTPSRPPLPSSSGSDASQGSAILPSVSKTATSNVVQSNSDRSIRTRLQNSSMTTNTAKTTATASLPSSPVLSGTTIRPPRALPARPVALYGVDVPVANRGEVARSADDTLINAGPGARSTIQVNRSVSTRSPVSQTRLDSVAVKPPTEASSASKAVTHITMRPAAQRATIHNARIQFKTKSDDVSNNISSLRTQDFPPRRDPPPPPKQSSNPPSALPRELPSPPARRGASEISRMPINRVVNHSGLPTKQAASSMPNLDTVVAPSSVPSQIQGVSTSQLPVSSTVGNRTQMKKKSSTLGRRTPVPLQVKGAEKPSLSGDVITDSQPSVTKSVKYFSSQT